MEHNQFNFKEIKVVLVETGDGGGVLSVMELLRLCRVLKGWQTLHEAFGNGPNPYREAIRAVTERAFGLLAQALRMQVQALLMERLGQPRKAKALRVQIQHGLLPRLHELGDACKLLIGRMGKEVAAC